MTQFMFRFVSEHGPMFVRSDLIFGFRQTDKGAAVLVGGILPEHEVLALNTTIEALADTYVS